MFLLNNYRVVAILYTLYFILYTILAWRRLDWAVLVAIFALPSYLIRFSLGSMPMTLLEVMILVIFLTWLIKNNLKLKIKNLKFFWPIMLFFLVATISIFVSPNLRAALGVWKAYFIEPILFFVVLKDLLRQKVRTDEPMTAIRDPRSAIGNLTIIQIITALSISAFILSAFAIYQKFTGFLIPHPWDQEAVRRVTGVFEYPNALALFLAPLVPLFIGQILSKKKLLVTGYWLLVTFASLLAIFYAHSTGALVGITVGLIFMVAIWLVVNHRTKFFIFHFSFFICVLAALGLFTFRISPDNFKDELLLNDWSGQVRQQMWKETRIMLKDRPILGAGLAGYQTAVAPYHKDNNIEIFLYPHNLVLNFWSETGLLGLTAFVLVIFNFFKLGFKKLFGNWKLEIGNLESDKGGKILLVATLASMVVIITHGLVDVPYFKNDLAILFWIIYALII